jgi:hypothetical protein
MKKDFYTANISQLYVFLDLSEKPDLSLSVKESTVPTAYHSLPNNPELFTNTHTSLGSELVETAGIPPS